MKLAATIRLPYLPSQIETIAADAVPGNVARALRAQTYDTIESPGLNIREFNRLMTLDLGCGHTAFFAQYVKIEPSENVTEVTAAEIEINEAGRVIGSGELALATDSDDDFFINKPYVGDTNSLECKRQGYGRRRILAMQAVSQLLFKLPLHSGTFFASPAAERVWLRLVRDGYAEQFLEPESPTGPLTRYRFIN
ncbi:MAG: hypothetical protein Q7R60_00570 [bacterium]|nr:hypothetical protein [bacterium]